MCVFVLNEPFESGLEEFNAAGIVGSHFFNNTGIHVEQAQD
jgi:hypothetical protein